MTDDRPAGASRRHDDLAEIAEVIDRFFAAFRSGADAAARLDGLRGLFLPGARIVRAGGEQWQAYDVEGFIAPRAALLSGGSLVDFAEWPVAGRVEVFGDVAHWFGSYAKRGVLDGAPSDGAGMKSLQLVRTGQGWRISAAAWDDEHPGLRLADRQERSHPA